MKKILCLMVICLVLITGCGEKENTFKTITSSKAYDMISKREDIIVLDVRSESEYKSAHIEGSVNVPLDAINKFDEIVTDNFDKTILVYCASGKRSKKASKELAEMGYKKVYNFGGLNNWNYDLIYEE